MLRSPALLQQHDLELRLPPLQQNRSVTQPSCSFPAVLCSSAAAPPFMSYSCIRLPAGEQHGTAASGYKQVHAAQQLQQA